MFCFKSARFCIEFRMIPACQIEFLKIDKRFPGKRVSLVHCIRLIVVLLIRSVGEGVT